MSTQIPDTTARPTTKLDLAAKIDGAARRLDWLDGAEDIWPEMAPLAERHRELVDAFSAADGARSDLAAKFRNEDQSYQRALASGSPLPTRTTVADQDEADRDALDAYLVARQALADHIEEVVTFMREHRDDMQAVLAERRAEADGQVNDAMAALRQAADERARMRGAERWLTMSTGYHVPVDSLDIANGHPVAGAPWHRPFPEVGQVRDDLDTRIDTLAASIT